MRAFARRPGWSRLHTAPHQRGSFEVRVVGWAAEVRGSVATAIKLRGERSAPALELLCDLVHDPRAHAVAEEREWLLFEQRHERVHDVVHQLGHALLLGLAHAAVPAGKLDWHDLHPTRQRARPTVKGPSAAARLPYGHSREDIKTREVNIAVIDKTRVIDATQC